jgi:hypothetical protein
MLEPTNFNHCGGRHCVAANLPVFALRCIGGLVKECKRNVKAAFTDRFAIPIYLNFQHPPLLGMA